MHKLNLNSCKLLLFFPSAYHWMKQLNVSAISSCFLSMVFPLISSKKNYPFGGISIFKTWLCQRKFQLEEMSCYSKHRWAPRELELVWFCGWMKKEVPHVSGTLDHKLACQQLNGALNYYLSRGFVVTRNICANFQKTSLHIFK